MIPHHVGRDHGASHLELGAGAVPKGFAHAFSQTFDDAILRHRRGNPQLSRDCLSVRTTESHDNRPIFHRFRVRTLKSDPVTELMFVRSF